MAKAKFNNEQAQWAFNEIADSARVAKTLCIQAIAEGDDVDAAGDIVSAVRAVVERIGLIADHHNDLEVNGDCTDWMLPPAYHGAADNGEAKS